jgi:hypothetical protein
LLDYRDRLPSRNIPKTAARDSPRVDRELAAIGMDRTIGRKGGQSVLMQTR